MVVNKLNMTSQKKLTKKTPILNPNPPQEIRCLICLEPIQNLQKCTIHECRHADFCFPCIEDWSKVTNKCPLCNQRYNYIEVPSTGALVLVDEKDQSDGAENIYADIQCQVCHLASGEEHMLLCDGCDHGYHTYCLGLSHIPYLDK